MKEIRSANFEEVLSYFQNENRASESQKKSDSFDWCIERLSALQRQSPNWKLIEVCTREILEIRVETGHNHSIGNSEPLILDGQTVKDAVERLRALDPTKIPSCWANINHQKDRDIAQTHFFLQWDGETCGTLMEFTE